MAEQTEDKNEIVTMTFGELHISHEDGKIPARYQQAKAEAERQGRKFIIDPAPASAPRVDPPGTIVIPRDASAFEYRRLKAVAEEKKVPYRVAD
jgi:hypothetical protein